MQQQNQQKQGERTSLARHYYAADLEAGVNKQINIELYGSYVYLSMVHDMFLYNFRDCLKFVRIPYIWACLKSK
jgi:hypothetical protein